MQFYLSHLNIILDNQFYSLIIDDIVEVDVERGCLTKTLQGTDVFKEYKYDDSENPYKNKYKYLRMLSSIHIQIDSLYSRSIYISILRWIMMYA